MILVLMNVFIAVVSEVYAKAQEESVAQFDASLELHIASNMHPKLVAQAEMMLMTHHWHNVLQRECSEVDNDQKPSTTADVRHLWNLMDQVQQTLQLVSGATFQEEVNGVLVGKSGKQEHMKMEEVVGMRKFIHDGFFSKVDHTDEQRHQKILQKMTDYKAKKL